MKRIFNYFPQSNVIPENAKIRVYNLSSLRTGDPVKNQFCIRVGFSDVRFQSYKTTCLVYSDGVLTVYPAAFGYSVTTSKYSRVFLEEECGLTASEVNEIRKLAKSEDFGEDCPLYIDIRGTWEA